MFLERGNVRTAWRVGWQILIVPIVALVSGYCSSAFVGRFKVNRSMLWNVDVQMIWQIPDTQHEFLWDFGMCADTSQGAVVRELISRACKGALAPAQHEVLFYTHLISLLFVRLSFQFWDKLHIYKFLLGDSTCILQRVGKYAMLNATIFILHSSFSYRVGLKDVEHIDGLSMALSCFGCEE